MDPHPDRLKAYQRAQVADKLDDQFVSIELGMVDAEEPTSVPQKFQSRRRKKRICSRKRRAGPGRRNPGNYLYE